MNVTDINALEQLLYHWDSNSDVSITLTNISYQWSTPLPSSESVHILYISAQDQAGNWQYWSFTYTTDGTPPTASYSGVSYNEKLVASKTHIIVVTPSDTHSITHVEFYLDGTQIENKTSPPYKWEWFTTGVKDGDHNITIRIYDIAGNMLEETFTVNVKNKESIWVQYGTQIIAGLITALITATFVFLRRYYMKQKGQG